MSSAFHSKNTSKYSSATNHVANTIFFKPKPEIYPTDSGFDREANGTVEKVARMPSTGESAFFSPKAIPIKPFVQTKCGPSEGEEKMLNERSDIVNVQRSRDDSYQPMTPSPNEDESIGTPVHFEAGSGNITKRDIKDSFYDYGNMFTFGWGEPYLFTWENEVVMHGAPGRSNWVVGVVQLMKDYWINIWWGDGPGQIHCGDSFPLVKVRDVFDSSYPWFLESTTSDSFRNDGDRKKTIIQDSPGAMSVPYQHPNHKDANFGHFNFGSTFFSYISAFNKAEPSSTDAWKHIKSVYWQTMLAGTFDARLPSDQRLKVTDGGLTEVGSVSNGYSEKFPPSLSGLTALEKICPIAKCWVPSWNCGSVTP